MTEDQNKNPQPKPRKIVKFFSLFKSESANTDSNNTGAQSRPIIPVNGDGKRRIYVINTTKVSGATRTPVILSSGIQPEQFSQITPQSSPTLNPVPTNEIEKQESLQKSSTDLESKTTSPTKTFRSRRDEIIDNAMKKMAEKYNTGIRPNQLVKSSPFLPDDEKDEEELKSAIVRARMPVRIHPHSNRKFSVLKYNKADVQLYSNGEIFLQRENNMDLYSKPPKKKSTGGAGSEFGAGSELKARFQKRGRELQEYSAETQPLLLTVGKGKSAKIYRGVKESTLIDSKYFIFTQRSNGGFDAYPVNEWYTVKQRINNKNLKDEKAERELSNRDEVYNNCNALKNPKQKISDQSIVIENTIVKPKLVLSEFEEWEACNQDDNYEVELENEECDIEQTIAQRRLEEKRRRRAAIVASKRRGRNVLARRKHKRNFVEGSDEEDGGQFDMAGEESDIDDYDGYELDYLTDSTSDEDKLSEDEREKIYEIPCIDQEMGFNSDDDDDDTNEEEEKSSENGGETEQEEKRKDAQSQQQNQRISGEIFLKEKENSEKTSLSSSSNSSCSSDTEEDIDEESQKKISKSSEPSKSFFSGKKRLPEGPSAESSPPQKRSKLTEIPRTSSSNPSVNVPQEGLFGTIRNYLLRRPITRNELMKKLGAKGLLSSDAAQNASRVAEVLQALKPLQQRVCGKDQLYLKH
nr:Transcription initiation factor IIF [Hymenolepis microstoma]